MLLGSWPCCMRSVRWHLVLWGSSFASMDAFLLCLDTCIFCSLPPEGVPQCTDPVWLNWAIFLYKKLAWSTCSSVGSPYRRKGNFIPQPWWGEGWFWYKVIWKQKTKFNSCGVKLRASWPRRSAWRGASLCCVGMWRKTNALGAGAGK